MNLNFAKSENGLIPVIIQHDLTAQVLMLGYMNQKALEQTQREKRVTFYSRSKQRLWTKGETSGNFLTVKSIQADCDQDTLLIKARPTGPTCHKGTDSCFEGDEPKHFLPVLENTIDSRIAANSEQSYTNRIFQKGLAKMAQKVGEEAVELVIEAMGDQDDRFKNEAADLLYHFLILLRGKNLRLSDIEAVLQERNKPR